MRTPAGYLFVGFGMKFTKPPITILEQIDLLRARGMEIEDQAVAEAALSRLNYYRLSAYWHPFYEGDPRRHRFRAGASFSSALRCYEFDRRLRLRLTDAIERFEVALRTQFSHQLAQRHGSWAYENPALFDRAKEHARRLSKLDNDIARSKDTFIKHYGKTYTVPERPPIWMIAEVVSLGWLSQMLKGLKARADRNAIAEAFGLDERVLTSFAEHITVVRNICAHHGRLWNRRHTVTLKLPEHGDDVLLKSLNEKAPHRIYNTIVILCWLLTAISDDDRWRGQVVGLLDEYPEIDPTHMGFPADWRGREIWAEAISR